MALKTTSKDKIKDTTTIEVSKDNRNLLTILKLEQGFDCINDVVTFILNHTPIVNKLMKQNENNANNAGEREKWQENKLIQETQD